jgi:hypothetical protein
MQFLLGFASYSNKAPFDLSMMVHFRKHFSEEDLKRINELIVERGKSMVMEAVSTHSDDDSSADLGVCRTFPQTKSSLSPCLGGVLSAVLSLGAERP